MTQLPNQGPGANVPPTGRVIVQVENVDLADGHRRQHRKVTVTYTDANGIVRTEEIDQKTPLDCGCAGYELNDVVVCSACGAQVCRAYHARNCQECGRVLCTPCVETVTVDGRDRALCPACAKEARLPGWLRVGVKLIRRVWDA